MDCNYTSCNATVSERDHYITAHYRKDNSTETINVMVTVISRKYQSSAPLPELLAYDMHIRITPQDLSHPESSGDFYDLSTTDEANRIFDWVNDVVTKLTGSNDPNHAARFTINSKLSEIMHSYPMLLN